jgi:hypothetical protein
MQKQIFKIIYLLIVFTAFPDLASAAPSITYAPAIFSDGQSISILGNAFGTKTTAAPKYFNNLENETTGQMPHDQITNSTSFGTTQENQAHDGKKSLEFDHNTTGGSSSRAEWRRTAVDLGAQGEDKIYLSLWIYLDKSLSSYDTSVYQVASYTPGDGVSVPVRIRTVLPNNYVTPNTIKISGFTSSSGNHPVNATRSITVIDSYTFDLSGYYNATPAASLGSVILVPSWQWKSFTITSAPGLYYDLSPSYPSSIWLNNKKYAISNKVTYGGKTYNNISAVTITSPVNDSPDSDTVHWSKVADYEYDHSQAYNATTAFVNYWWYADGNRWGNSHGQGYYYNYPTETNKPAAVIQSAPSDALVWNQWQRLEFYAQRSSAGGAADGIWREQRIGRDGQTFNITNAITHQAGNDPWRYLVLSNALESSYTGHTNLKIYMDDIYVDTSQARVEICDSATWSARTHCEIQRSTAWPTGADPTTNIAVDINQGTFANNSMAYLYVVANDGSVNSNGYVISFAAQTDFTAPAAPNGLLVQ